MQYSVFGSILTFGAMIGAITSGPIADFIGRKGVRNGCSYVSIGVELHQLCGNQSLNIFSN